MYDKIVWLKTSSGVEILFVWGFFAWLCRFWSSDIDRICMALLGPIPFICWSSFSEQSNSLSNPCSAISLLDMSITFSCIVPVLRNIARSSASLRVSGPYFRNLSRGRFCFGRSRIFMGR